SCCARCSPATSIPMCSPSSSPCWMTTKSRTNFCLRPVSVVIFDLGHAAGSFWFRLAIPAMQNGFSPDSISTDPPIGNVNGPVVDMLTTMSKLLNIGMPLNEVIYRSTVTPAHEIAHPELGTLSVGAEADIALLRLEEGQFTFTDCGRAKFSGAHKLT